MYGIIVMPPKEEESSPNKSPQQHQQHSLQVLRVAQQELSSGNQSGSVFCQLSPGAVAFAYERPVLQARVSRLLHQAILQQEEDNDALLKTSSS